MIFDRMRVIKVLTPLILLMVFFVGCTAPALCTVVKEVPMSVTVVELERKMVGLNTDNDNLTFGVVSAGSIVERFVDVEYDSDADVLLVPQGNMTPWLDLQPSSFFLPEQGTQKVSAKIQVPLLTPPGDYTGSLQFCFKKK